jgi:hypothetical protein|tara:strand:- start:12154 stop:12417 length:264 start_codon:yes stop_codon:yes gene_type:complete
MKKRTRSILDELNNIHSSQDNDYLISTTANNIIESSINLLNRIASEYDADTAGELERRFINSIKAGDARKFKRGIDKIIESKKNDSK